MSFTATDIESFRLQLQQVEAALQVAPGDEELLKLKSDLDQLLSLANSIYQPDTARAEAIGTWKVGQKCEALYRADGQFYAAKIEDISLDGNRVTVTYLEYGTVDEVATTQLRPISAVAEVGVKAKLNKKEEQKKKKEKLEKRKQKLAELEAQQEAEKKKWQAFNSKVMKKTKKKQSIFATSEHGKVGVTGSGKGMTDFHTREKYDKIKKAQGADDED